MARETRREKFRRGLSELYLPHYDKLCELLGNRWQPMSGFRTFQEQAKLYAYGRTEAGPVVTKAPPGMSLHNYGLASDWWYFSDEQGSRMENLDAGHPRWNEYLNACEAAGLKCITWERPHNQLILPAGLCVDMLHAEFQNKGQAGVEKMIKFYFDHPVKKKGI